MLDSYIIYHWLFQDTSQLHHLESGHDAGAWVDGELPTGSQQIQNGFTRE